MAKRKGKKGASTLGEDVLLIESNKKARHDYELTDFFEAGIVLLGSEVKSVRNGGVSLKESYVRVENSEVFLVGARIAPYSHSRVEEHDPIRPKKLLLHAREISKLDASSRKKGLTIVPTRIYFRKGRCKVEIALGKGRKLYDKREALREKEARRIVERSLKIRS